MIVSKEKTSSSHLPLLQKLQIYNKLNEELKKEFIEKSNIIIIQTGKNVSDEFALEHDYIYLLLEGTAFISCIENHGNKIILEMLKAGSVFGYLEEEESKENKDCHYIEPYPEKIITLCALKKQDFLSILSKNPSLALYIFSHLSKRMARLERKIEELNFLDLETRLLKELERLGQPINGTDNSTIIVKSQITHEKLAQLLGVVRETVSKTLVKLKKEGLIFYNRKNLFVYFLRRKETPITKIH